MNFLAHLFLSGDNQEILVGNMLEDYVVGRIEHPRNSNFSYNIKKGILLHRLIDSFTDTHALINASKSVLYDKYHKYASVVIDIFFDHYLARHWHLYSSEPFDAFRTRVHQAFIDHWQLLPEKMKPVIESMIKYDWLKNYAEFWGIERALSGVAKRAVFVSNMEQAVTDLQAHYSFFDENFREFFPQLVHECTAFLKENHFSHNSIIIN